MRALFWICLIGAAYSYFLYPLLLAVLPRRKPAVRTPQYEPVVTLIVTAHNEAARIGTKLDNALALIYPREKFEIVVASDASSDGTDALVRSYADRGVRLVRAEERKGKEHAQWHAIRAARGEILVFSDVATDMPPDSIRRLVANFADPKIGAVSSEDRFVAADGKIVGEGAYVRYEMALRRLESNVNSLVGLSGSFFAARREVCAQWDIQVPSDFNTALNCVRLGFVAVSDPNVIGYYRGISDEKKEYQRKLRTVIRGMQAIARQPVVLNPFKMKLFALQVWSHKVMRWLVPWFLMVLFAVSLALSHRHWVYLTALAAQVAFYSLAVFAWLSPLLRARALAKIPFFFVQANIAIAHAMLQFLGGKRVTVWDPSKR